MWGVLLHITYDTNWDDELFKLYSLVMHAVSERRRESRIVVAKKILILALKWPQVLNLYLWLRENVSLPMVFCSSHWNLNPAVRLFHRKESLGCSYFRFCSHEKWIERPLLHDHWYIISILSKTTLLNKAQVGLASIWKTVCHVRI